MACLHSSQLLAGGVDDNPLLLMVMVDQLEIHLVEGNDPLLLDFQSWIGKDLHKLWLKAEIERVGNETEKNELQLFYSHAFASYWDWQIGMRHDFQPKPHQSWLAFGIEGLAPYWFDVEATLFLGERGQTALRFKTEYELMLSQRWILSPEFEINFHGKNDSRKGIGSGLSDLELGLRLRYRIRREWRPYVGLNWSKKFGNTAGFARAEGDIHDDIKAVVGVSFWF